MYEDGDLTELRDCKIAGMRIEFAIRNPKSAIRQW